MDALGVETLVIRPAGREDLPDVLALYADPELDGAEVLPLDDAHAAFDTVTAVPGYTVYVAELGQRVVGTYSLIILPLIAHQGRNFGVVESVAVAPQVRSLGIGRELMRHAEDQCAKADCYKMALSSNVKRDRAHAFYEREGFTLHGYSFAIAPKPEGRL